MKQQLPFGLLGLFLAAPLSAQSLYSVGADPQESSPLKWSVGVNFIYDDNVRPGVGSKEDKFAANPFVGVAFINKSPQTTIDLYARLGLIYYFDAPNGMDDTNSQSRLGLSISHNVSERLRISSRNFVSYELEPDYSYGYATSRAGGEYFYWQSDNAVGFRWSERFGTYTGVRVGGLDYDASNNDRFYVEPYNQFRYQLTPQTVLTAEYRYRWTQSEGLANDGTDQYILVGAEHRFTPTTVGVLRMGAQIHELDGGDTHTSPYLEASLNSQATQQLSLRAYARYGYENWDTVLIGKNGTMAEFDERRSLRLGVSGNYAVSDRLSLFSGIDYMPTEYKNGRNPRGIAGSNRGADFDEEIFNAYVGFSVKLTDYLFGNVSYNYTTSSSDVAGRDYDRNRVSVGISAEF